MSYAALNRLAPLVLCVGAALAPQAQATTQAVQLNVLNATVTLPTPLLGGDTLLLDTLVTTQTGALSQTINFSLGASVASLTGQAVWEVDTATGTGPRVVGVNIDIFNASNALVTSDSFSGTLAGFAASTFASAIGPGSYRMVVTGTAVRDTVLDVTLSFLPSAVPEPASQAMMLLGLAGMAGLLARRRRR